MKNLLLLAFIFATVFSLNAQNKAQQKSYILGGSFNFIHNKNSYGTPRIVNGMIIGEVISREDITTTDFSISSYLGREITPHIILGLNASFGFSSSTFYSYNTSNQPTRFDTNGTELGVGVFGRYIFNPAQKLNFYIQPSVGYNWLTENLTSETIAAQKSTSNYFGAAIDLGMNYQLSDRFRLLVQSGGLEYYAGAYKNGPVENDFSVFGTNLNLSSIRFGVELEF